MGNLEDLLKEKTSEEKNVKELFLDSLFPKYRSVKKNKLEDYISAFFNELFSIISHLLMLYGLSTLLGFNFAYLLIAVFSFDTITNVFPRQLIDLLKWFYKNVLKLIYKYLKIILNGLKWLFLPIIRIFTTNK